MGQFAIGRREIRSGVGLAALALSAGAFAAPAQAIGMAADEPSAAESIKSDSGERADDIVVTARRRAEDPQKVPIALSVFSGAALEKQNVFSLDQLQRQAPSLQIIGNNPRNTNINIRGLGANIGLQNDGLENGVGVYVDDVYYARTGQATFDLVDIDHIELLRGPQGTLFGKNTTAGALSIYTRAPSFTPDFKADATVGNYGNYQLRASASAPLIGDRVAARLSVAQTANDGYVYDTATGRRLNDYNNFTVRGQILAKVGNDVTLRLIGDYGRQHEDGYAAVNISVIPVPGRGIAVRAAQAGYTLPTIDPFSRRVDNDLTPSVKMSQGGGSAKLDWTLPGHVLTAITAYRFWNWSPRNDADGTALPVLTAAYNESRQSQFTQELRLASTGDGPIKYVVGGFYFHQNLDSHALTAYGSAAPIWLLGADTPVTRAALNGFAVTGDSKLRTNSYAGFGQLTWNITSKLALTVGGRYTNETKEGSFVQTVAGPDLSGLTAAQQATALATRAAFGGPNAYLARTSEGKFSGQANLAYQFSDAVLGYATYSRGFKSGGLTLTNVAANVPKVIAPESIDHYEVGLKTRTADHRLTLNLAAFWTEDNDYQATIYDPIKTTTYVANVGKVRSRGIEAEGWFNPFEGLTTYGSITYLDAKYLSFQDAPCPIEQLPQAVCDLSGRRLPGAPTWSAAAGGEYTHAVSDTVKAYFGADYSYRSSIYYASNLSPSSLISGYSLVNARLGARINDHFDLSVWARNIFDKDYYVTRQAAAFNTGLVSGIIGEPRVFGVTGRVRY